MREEPVMGPGLFTSAAQRRSDGYALYGHGVREHSPRHLILDIRADSDGRRFYFCHDTVKGGGGCVFDRSVTGNLQVDL